MKKSARFLSVVLLAGLLLVAGGGVTIWYRLQGSLPQLDGTVQVTGLRGPVRITRDKDGIPDIRAGDREDLALALGYLHGQERFFQMDLQRRSGAGELAALLGPAAVGKDRAHRVHRFRYRARQHLAAEKPATRRVLTAYARGVNQGLAELDEVPFEYLLLGAEPLPWKEEDSLLVLYSMYFVLQDPEGRRELALAAMEDTLGKPMTQFLSGDGDFGDALLEGAAGELPAVPGPEVARLPAGRKSGFRPPPEETVIVGSNNWALAGGRSSHGGALVANDMHQALTMPNLWYRARMGYPGQDLSGITLPGSPVLIIGSNGQVAWGFTNSGVDRVDRIIPDWLDEEGRAYRTANGSRSVTRHEEVIRIKGEEHQTLVVRETIAGPLTGRDHRGRETACWWTAHHVRGSFSGYLALEQAADADRAIGAAHRLGIPVQNFVVGDRAGRIAWTLTGPVPDRQGRSGRLPLPMDQFPVTGRLWADGATIPVIRDPAAGMVWSANNKVILKAGEGRFAPGARASRIRDVLAAAGTANEQAMLALQLDDRDLVHEKWAWIIAGLGREYGDLPWVARLAATATGWDGHARRDSEAYPVIRRFRQEVMALVLPPLLEPVRQAWPDFRLRDVTRRREGMLHALIRQQPLHLLNRDYGTWNELLLDALRRTNAHLVESEGPVAARWGDENRLRMRHPLSGALPVVGSWLNMDATRLSGVGYAVNALYRGHGPSQRMVVSPGREDQGIMQMPGGQSGHPLSPYYRSQHEAWLQGRPVPFHPGPARWNLTLQPRPG